MERPYSIWANIWEKSWKQATVLKSKSSVHDYFNPYVKPKERYYKNRLRLGYEEFTRLGKTEKKDFWLDVSTSGVSIILGKRDSGKTWILRRLMDTAFYTGFAPVVPCDVKNEFVSSLKPADTDQQQFLAAREFARPTPVKIYYPHFLGDCPDKNEPLQISLFDITYSDLLTIFKLTETGSSIAQTSVLMHLYNLIREEKITNMNEFLEELDDMEDAKPVTKQSIRMIANNVINSEIIGNKFTVNIPRIFEEDQIPVLDLVGYEELGLHTAASYVAIFIRKIMAARKRKLIKKPMFFLIDEAHEFCNAHSNLSSKHEIQKLVNLSRTWGISIVLATQSLEDIPPKIMRQARYIFLPQGVTWDEGKEIMKSRSFLEWDRDSYNELIYLFKHLRRKKNNEREWLCVDANKGEYTRFFPYAPFSLHQRESRW